MFEGCYKCSFLSPCQLFVYMYSLIEIQSTQLRLSLVRQLLKFTKRWNLSLKKLLHVRHLDSLIPVGTLPKSKIKQRTLDSWKRHWKTFCSRSATSEGLIFLIPGPVILLSTDSIPKRADPKLTGSLCALLAGHTRLQLHKHKLGLTFSPTCICLAEHESPMHFIFSCYLYSNHSSEIHPDVCNWPSILGVFKKNWSPCLTHLV